MGCARSTCCDNNSSCVKRLLIFVFFFWQFRFFVQHHLRRTSTALCSSSTSLPPSPNGHRCISISTETKSMSNALKCPSEAKTSMRETLQKKKRTEKHMECEAWRILLLHFIFFIFRRSYVIHLAFVDSFQCFWIFFFSSVFVFAFATRSIFKCDTFNMRAHEKIAIHTVPTTNALRTEREVNRKKTIRVFNVYADRRRCKMARTPNRMMEKCAKTKTK